MPERSIVRRATALGYATPSAAPIYVDSDDNTVKIIPAGSGTTEVALAQAVSTSGSKYAAGVAALVTGAVTVTTGLTTVLSAMAAPAAQPNATGAASPQIIVATWATGAVTFTAYSISSVTGATTAANTATGNINWVAVGV